MPAQVLSSGVAGLLKSRPEDFIVDECGVPVLPSESGEFSLLRLTKRGMTTFEAVKVLADQLGVAPEDVGYAGLKDEDGVTSQVVSVPVSSSPGAPVATGSDQVEGPYLVARPIGRSPVALRAGAHGGNMFSLVVRRLPDPIGRRISSEAQRTIHFLNYYDLQRFGLPGKPKVTHLVGQALAEQDYESALRWLRHGQSTDADAAVRDAAAYFGSLDARVVAFYLSAYESYLWNQRLSDEIGSRSPGARVLTREGLSISMVASERDRLAVLADVPTLPRPKYRARDGAVVREVNERATVVQAHVTFGEAHRVDEDWDCACHFYLPPGCYATMLVLQLIETA
ncbi:MAG TPA: tRNA pseudouridine(13) synthase TruD [Solirubrobacterales bacterium]|jgi:tRNA pseudouridine13 synthase|nr:tRNA pseudouridine(13) synthase TruD [Solirubrobacterales bacterium]